MVSVTFLLLIIGALQDIGFLEDFVFFNWYLNDNKKYI